MILVILASWALAGNPSATPTVAVNPKKLDPLICREVERTGTRMGGGRICRTESQWRKDKDDAERMLNGRRDLENPPPPAFAPPSPQ